MNYADYNVAMKEVKMSEVKLDEHAVEYFSTERMNEEDMDCLWMAMSEDDLVYMHGLTIELLELLTHLGSRPPIELASLQSRMSEALSQFYGEE